ncbi:DNA-binding protein [Brucella anthropi]|uniref:helix-turn-helix transcriptional regulator n=1 Tax=Brucella anthropi TaxID=529 RepID=UPI003987C014
MIPSRQIETIVPQHFDIAEIGEEKGRKLCASMLAPMVGDVSLVKDGAAGGAVRGACCFVGSLRIMTCYFPGCAIGIRGNGDGLPDQLLMVRSMEGPLRVHQSGQTLNLKPGDVTFLSSDRPFDWWLPDGGRIDCGSLPANYFPVSKQKVGSFLMRPIPQAHPPLKLLITHCAYLLMRAHAPGEAEMIVAHFRQVLPMVLEFLQDGNRNVRTGTSLGQIKAFMETRLSDAALDLGSVAAKFGVTPRQVQKLFQAEETTFSRYVLERRLDMARLRILHQNNRSISSIAYEVGFGDLSYFNRVFRRCFGMTPSAMRGRSDMAPRHRNNWAAS